MGSLLDASLQSARLWKARGRQVPASKLLRRIQRRSPRVAPRGRNEAGKVAEEAEAARMGPVSAAKLQGRFEESGSFGLGS